MWWVKPQQLTAVVRKPRASTVLARCVLYTLAVACTAHTRVPITLCLPSFTCSPTCPPHHPTPLLAVNTHNTHTNQQQVLATSGAWQGPPCTAWRCAQCRAFATCWARWQTHSQTARARCVSLSVPSPCRVLLWCEICEAGRPFFPPQKASTVLLSIYPFCSRPHPPPPPHTPTHPHKTGCAVVQHA